MDRRKQASNTSRTATIEGANHGDHGACAVCGTRDARLLVTVELRGGAAATLCGSHALLHSRMSEPCGSVTELRSMLGERRGTERRARLEGDELAERLTAAFTRERRSVERRVG